MQRRSIRLILVFLKSVTVRPSGSVSRHSRAPTVPTVRPRPRGRPGTGNRKDRRPRPSGSRSLAGMHWAGRDVRTHSRTCPDAAHVPGREDAPPGGDPTSRRAAARARTRGCTAWRWTDVTTHSRTCPDARMHRLEVTRRHDAQPHVPRREDAPPGGDPTSRRTAARARTPRPHAWEKSHSHLWAERGGAPPRLWLASGCRGRLASGRRGPGGSGLLQREPRTLGSEPGLGWG
ncbi:uncharacterized protein LOC122094997 [Dipodomys spectabilis]|uniref:uncharacterized protein LOC122094997 n=1 Tax=Dipodomys spectabilis TaxID=105255 RepID=UPI001C53BC46|nr:uncharacterized protein LOC122094997 [Dipodomys spectabilis]